MTPPITPADLLEKRSTNGSNNVIIISAVVGGVFVTTAVIVLYVTLARRASSNSRHSRNLSNTSVPLLQSESRRRTELVTPPLHHFPLPSDNIRSKVFTDSSSLIKSFQRDEAESQPRVAMSVISSRIPAAKPTLSSLSIPSQSHRIPTTNISTSPPTSESLYSQQSASTVHIASTPPARKSLSPSLLPPMVPQYAYIRQETADLSARADKHTMGKLLKERAKHSERKSTRGVSIIERPGSVEPASDSDTSDDESEFVYQQRSSVKSGEWLNSALAAR